VPARWEFAFDNGRSRRRLRRRYRIHVACGAHRVRPPICRRGRSRRLERFRVRDV